MVKSDEEDGKQTAPDADAPDAVGNKSPPKGRCQTNGSSSACGAVSPNRYRVQLVLQRLTDDIECPPLRGVGGEISNVSSANAPLRRGRAD